MTMSRTQAEHLLSAYVEMTGKKDVDAAEALKEVILDAMSSSYITTVPYYPYRYPGITWTTSGTGTLKCDQITTGTLVNGSNEATINKSVIS